jgi:hypothetical protein
VRYSGVRRSAVVAAVMLAAACSDQSSVAVPGAGAFGGGFSAGGTSGFGGFAGSAAFTGTGGSGAIAGFGAVAGAIELPTDPAANGAPLATGALPNEYAPENCAAMYGFGTACVQYFACALDCSFGNPCPNGQSGTVRVRCAMEPFSSPTCVLGCGEGAVCPNGMQCVVTGDPTLGSICLWPDHLLREGCPGWCSQNGSDCTIGAADDCCSGSVCAPWGQCVLATCLEPRWPCAEGGPQCCSGTCQNGLCL